MNLSSRSRYNLKRRVASLPPISSEVFAEKVISAQASNSAAAAKATFEKFCEACQKTYYSENAFLNHLGSQKHKIKDAVLRKCGTRDETGSIISGAFSLGEPINSPTGEVLQRNRAISDASDLTNGVKGVTLVDRTKSNGASEEQSGLASEKSTEENRALLHCLFCNYKSPNPKLNVHHMVKYHGMFIPEQEYLVDLEGLIKYFYAKIMENSECLYCHKIKQSPSAVQTHMRDKGHCMIAFETEDEMLEVGQFYDFSSTYSDEEDETTDDQDGGDEDAGWETDSSTSSVDTAEIGSIPIDDHSHQYAKLSKHKHHSHEDPRPHRNADGFHSHAHNHSRAAFYSDYELHLPSGRTAGHRSLARYFRQNLRNYATTPEERLERQRAIEAGPSNGTGEPGDAANTDRAVISRAKGGLGMLGATDSQKREVRVAQERGRDREQRATQRYQWGVEKRANNQNHFRVSLLLASHRTALLFAQTNMSRFLLGSSSAISQDFAGFQRLLHSLPIHY
jgi:pre-60S factor REI1